MARSADQVRKLVDHDGYLGGLRVRAQRSPFPAERSLSMRARPQSARRPTGPIHLKGGLSSSLYSLRAGRDLGLILAVDDDPIFGQILVTLFRVVRHGEVDRSYRSIAHLLYRNQIERNGRAL